MWKIIISDIRELWRWLGEWYLLRRFGMKISLAIKFADLKQRVWNKQYHVMIISTTVKDDILKERLIPVNNQEIERLKRKKWIPKKATMNSLRNSIFYSTPLSRNNKSTPEDRRKAKEKYIKYVKRFSKRRLPV